MTDREIIERLARLIRDCPHCAGTGFHPCRARTGAACRECGGLGETLDARHYVEVIREAVGLPERPEPATRERPHRAAEADVDRGAAPYREIGRLRAQRDELVRACSQLLELAEAYAPRRDGENRAVANARHVLHWIQEA